MKRMYTKKTPLPLLRVCSRMDVHNSASWTLHRYGDDVIHHAYRRRERGLKDQEDSAEVLDVLLPLGGGHLRVLDWYGTSAVVPHHSLICSTRKASDARMVR